METSPRIRVGAVLVRGKHVLLMGRVRNRRHYYTFPGGGVEAGESLEQALVREIDEEFGLAVKPGKLLFHYETPRKVEYFYLVRGFQGNPVLGGEEKASMTNQNRYFPAWRPMADIARMHNLYPENARAVIAQFLQSRLAAKPGQHGRRRVIASRSKTQ